MAGTVLWLLHLGPAVPAPISRRDLVALLALAPLALAPLGACARRVDRTGPKDDEALRALVAAARSRPATFALQGRFTIRLEGPGLAGTTKGALVLAQPDRFRVEVHNPVGPPMMLLASDGRALNVWVSKNNRFYRGEDASQVLQQLTGGAVQLSDVNLLLTGGLPLPEAEIRDLRLDEDGLVRLSLAAPEGVSVHAALDPSTGLLRQMEVVAAPTGLDPGVALPQAMVVVEVLSTMKVGDQRLPESMLVRMPTLGWTVGLDFVSWDELGQIPEVFALSPPPGAGEQDLVGALRTIALGGVAPGR